MARNALAALYGYKGEPLPQGSGTGRSIPRSGISEYDGLHHDVGFMWHISSGLDYRLTGNRDSRVRTLLAANMLMGRYNVEGNYLRAWNDRENEKNIGWALLTV